MAAGGAEPNAVPPTGTAPLLAVLGLVAIGGCILLAVVTLDARRADLVEQEATADAEREAGRVAIALKSAEAVVENIDPMLCDPRASADSPGPDFGASPSAQPVPQGTTLVCLPAGESQHRAAPSVDFAAPAIQAALAQSRDRGMAALSAPPAGAAASPVVAAPIYRVGTRLSLEPSERTTSIRREELAGHAVAVLDVAALLGDRPGWEISDGGVVLARTGPQDLDDGARASADLLALERRWTVSTELPGQVLWRPISGGVALLGVLGAVLLGLADRKRRQQMRTQASAMRRAEVRAGAIRTLTGIVQHGQDLDEILPALAVQLSDELGLDGISLALAASAGQERAIFSHGERPDPDARPGRLRGDSVPSGATVAIDLHRAERSIAVLRVVAGEELDSQGLELLHVAGEMITSTIVAGRSLEQQQEAVNRLEYLDELKTTFLGVASHELRTPATAISGLATLLATRWDALTEDDRRAFATRIANNADALNALVQDLLDFARLERGDLQLVLAPVDLSATVDRVLTRLDSAWDSHRVTRHLDPGAEVLGDVNAIERVVTNLVSNAVKFSPPAADVTVSVTEHGGRVRLLVDDAGPGVPEEERAKIFVRFFRGAGDAIVRTRGVGIGLSVVQDFVSQMGGQVHVQDSPQGGARFVVELEALDQARHEERDAATT